MAISPPSDLILDVVRAADPAASQAAAARLARITPGDGVAFTAAYRQIVAPEGDRTPQPPASPPAGALPTGTPSGPPVARSPLEALQAFEGMALATMIQSAMPDEDNAMFGTGPSAGVWKSMLAEQLGAQMARAGGIGLAEQLATHPAFAAEADTTRTLMTTQAERTAFDALDDGSTS